MPERPKILVVDDEERNLRLMTAMLEPQGYAVVLARDGAEALQKARMDLPDVVLLDIMMPGTDGFEVAKQLKHGEETRDVPIIMVTALNEVDDRVKALEVGADDFLTKPVDKTELKARVRSSLKVKAYYDHMRDHQKELESEVARRTLQLRETMAKLSAASLETIYRLSRAAEYRDENTGAHVLRVSHYSAAVAQRIGLNQTAIDEILYAAPMHDVGKIGIPDSILLKPGKLDPKEWEIMKQHTIIGGRILENPGSGFLKAAEVIALSHHEKWDGKGYPQGMQGAAIPLFGRITAIADVFDALTTVRPYKKAFPIDESLRIILQNRGTHFDPDVVDAFMAVEVEVRAIRERYEDPHESLLHRMMEGTLKPSLGDPALG